MITDYLLCLKGSLLCTDGVRGIYHIVNFQFIAAGGVLPCIVPAWMGNLSQDHDQPSIYTHESGNLSCSDIGASEEEEDSNSFYSTEDCITRGEMSNCLVSDTLVPPAPPAFFMGQA